MPADQKHPGLVAHDVQGELGPVVVRPRLPRPRRHLHPVRLPARPRGTKLSTPSPPEAPTSITWAGEGAPPLQKSDGRRTPGQALHPELHPDVHGVRMKATGGSLHRLHPEIRRRFPLRGRGEHREREALRGGAGSLGVPAVGDQDHPGQLGPRLAPAPRASAEGLSPRWQRASGAQAAPVHGRGRVPQGDVLDPVVLPHALVQIAPGQPAGCGGTGGVGPQCHAPRSRPSPRQGERFARSRSTSRAGRSTATATRASDAAAGPAGRRGGGAKAPGSTGVRRPGPARPPRPGRRTTPGAR